jgi:hypothetical protein
MEWQKNKGVHPKASNSKLKVDRPDHLNYFNCMNDSGKITSCGAVTGRKLSTFSSVADRYTLLMNIWNTLPESCQQRVYNNTLLTVKHQIKQPENPTPARVFSVEAVCVDNAILRYDLTSEVVLEEPEIGTTDPNIPIDNDCTDDEPDFGRPGGSGDFEDEGDERETIPNTSRRRQAVTELERFVLGTRDVNMYEGDDGDDVDEDEEEEASQANDGSTQNVEDSGTSTREYEDWAVYFRHVK